MWRILKAILVLLLLGFIGLVVYSYVALPTPEPQRVTKPVVLNGN